MNSDEFKKILLEIKKQRVIEVIYSVCKREGLPIPKVNFNGCPQETEDQLAHYHPDQNKICISEIQLYKLKTLKDIEDTVYHELAHILEYNHSGRFIQIKNKFKLDDWKPPPDVQFIRGDQVNEQSKEIREDPKKLAEVNEDSLYIKIIEGRATQHEDSKANYAAMAKSDTEEARRKSGITIEESEKSQSNESAYKVNRVSGNKKIKKRNISDKNLRKMSLGSKEKYERQQKSIQKTHENINASLTDDYGESSHNIKKRGLIEKIKDALSIN
ncbi:MAG: hypothetical protein QXS81_04150 [Candidatus Micrarchaeaceae archaeon]